jgi:hypothetical protein
VQRTVLFAHHTHTVANLPQHWTSSVLVV